MMTHPLLNLRQLHKKSSNGFCVFEVITMVFSYQSNLDQFELGNNFWGGLAISEKLAETPNSSK